MYPHQFTPREDPFKASFCFYHSKCQPELLTREDGRYTSLTSGECNCLRNPACLLPPASRFSPTQVRFPVLPRFLSADHPVDQLPCRFRPKWWMYHLEYSWAAPARRAFPSKRGYHPTGETVDAPGINAPHCGSGVSAPIPSPAINTNLTPLCVG